MKCKVDGCGADAMYTGQQVCQKHYFRFMRNGSYETKKPKGRYIDSSGYVRLLQPEHPLSASNGVVMEHRIVAHKKYGDNLPPCELCGTAVNWLTVHIDHIDNDRANNAAANLRPLCRVCNTTRTERRNVERYEFAGLRLSLLEWAKQPGVNGTRAALKRRMDAGMTFPQALFATNPTHPRARQWEAA